MFASSYLHFLYQKFFSKNKVFGIRLQEIFLTLLQKLYPKCFYFASLKWSSYKPTYSSKPFQGLSCIFKKIFPINSTAHQKNQITFFDAVQLTRRKQYRFVNRTTSKRWVRRWCYYFYKVFSFKPSFLHLSHHTYFYCNKLQHLQKQRKYFFISINYQINLLFHSYYKHDKFIMLLNLKMLKYISGYKKVKAVKLIQVVRKILDEKHILLPLIKVVDSKYLLNFHSFQKSSQHIQLHHFFCFTQMLLFFNSGSLKRCKHYYTYVANYVTLPEKAFIYLREFKLLKTFINLERTTLGNEELTLTRLYCIFRRRRSIKFIFNMLQYRFLSVSWVASSCANDSHLSYLKLKRTEHYFLNKKYLFVKKRNSVYHFLPFGLLYERAYYNASNIKNTYFSYSQLRTKIFKGFYCPHSYNTFYLFKFKNKVSKQRAIPNALFDKLFQ